MIVRLSLKKGLSFGLGSGIVTTLGLIVGLHSGTHSRLVIISGILVIAVADALSDAMGIHLSEESEQKRTEQHIWKATVATFFAKFFFALTFLIPISLFELNTAIIVSIIYGMILLTLFSIWIAHLRNKPAGKMIIEHLLLAIVVVLLSSIVGRWAGTIG